ncbi:MAG: hypothetical protein ACREQT_02610, partial [Candidatus Binataceae bacterium]
MLALALALTTAAAGALAPRAAMGMTALLVLILIVCFLSLGPRRALQWSFFIIFIGETKFRSRDIYLALSGNVDTQI